MTTEAEPQPAARPRIALALGSGGARGYAHIGVIQVLEERGFDIVTVAGSSMGALVGGVHAAGRLADYTEWAMGLNRADVLRLLDPAIAAPGAIRAEKIFTRVRELLQGVLIEQLPVPYTAVATDLLARKEVWFQDGPLAVAIRASVAIPGVITPVMLNGRLLADGGLMNPVPIAPTAAVHVDATVAVSLGGERRGFSGVPDRETSASRPVEEWAERFRRTAASWLDRDVIRSVTNRFGSQHSPADHSDDEFGELPAGLGRIDVFTQSLEVVESVLTRYRLAGYPPDVLITIPKDACRSLEFYRAGEMIELGRAAAAEALDQAGLMTSG